MEFKANKCLYLNGFEYETVLYFFYILDFLIFFFFPDTSHRRLQSVEKCRVFRPDKSYAVIQGKWYFEFEVLTAGSMRVGWARPGCGPDKELGSDDQAFTFDGSEVSFWMFTSLTGIYSHETEQQQSSQIHHWHKVTHSFCVV